MKVDFYFTSKLCILRICIVYRCGMLQAFPNQNTPQNLELYKDVELIPRTNSSISRNK